MSAAGARLRSWNAAIDATGDVRALSVLRIVLGPIVLLHFRSTFERALDGVVYSDRFWMPYADWYPEASRGLYQAMLVIVAVTAVTMSIGLFTRWSTAITAFVVGYHIFLSTTHFAHNRAFLLVLLVTVSLLPVDRFYSVDAWWRRRRGTSGEAPARLWPIWLVRFEVVVVYSSSAISKLVDPDWWGGLMMQRRAIDNRQQALDAGVPDWLIDVFADGTFQWWFSKSAVLAELVIAWGFLHRRTRLLAIWIAIPFHLSIEVVARVQVFSWAAIAALVIWVTPRARERVLHVPVDHPIGGVVRRLDWFGRFDLRPSPDAGPVLDDPTDRVAHGVWRGRDALVATLLRLPATFWFAAPWWLWRVVSRRAGSAPEPAPRAPDPVPAG